MKKLIPTALFLIWSFTSYITFGQGTHFNYISPVPGSEYINPEQSIILKTGTLFDIESIDECNIEIKGSETGNHSFTWKISEDSKSIVIIPDNSFIYNETVSVNITQGLKTNDGSEISGTSFNFKIKTQDNLKLLEEYYRNEYGNEAPKNNEIERKPTSRTFGRDYNVPANYPEPVVTHYGETDDDYLFFDLNPRLGSQQYKNYLSINDKFGVPIFFRRTENNSLNFHKLPDGRLAYARNDYGHPENEKYFFLDSAYVVVDSVKTGNGYNMDGHDMLLLENGHYLLMSYDPQPVNMSLIVIGGNPNAIVTGLVLQEVDIAGTVYFQWRSWDYFSILDATDDINLLAAQIDYVHGNAFAFDTDGNLLLSSRHLDEITKIDYETGNIIYRFGLNSKNNEFTISNDPVGFSHQHDIRVQPNGNITLFDNGNLHPNPFSQAIEYDISESDRTATRVWNYQHNPPVYGPATGSFRRSETGKNLIGWGATGPLAASELDENDNPTFDVFLPDGVLSYRTLKYPWKTNLFTTPSLIEFGNFNGYNEPKKMIIPIYNNSANQIRINSTYNHSGIFEVVDELPITIMAGETEELTVSFDPAEVGTYDDRLTLNYDKFSLSSTERIARQLDLNGIWDNSVPSVTFLPEFGTSGVDPETAIIVLFSEPVRKVGGEMINNDDIPDLFIFKTSNQWGDDIPFTGYISEDRQQITIFPDIILAEMQQYFVQLLSMTIEDDQENAIEFPETTVFTTGVLTNMESNNDADGILLYPSPFIESLIIISKDQPIGYIKIYKISGVEIYNSYTSYHRIEIDTRHVSNGIYFVKIINDLGKSSISKIMKIM